jgi:fucose permease
LPSEANTRSWRSFVVYSYLAFIVLGALTTMLGPLLPVIARRWALHTAAVGVLFSFQFGGSIVGTLVSATQTGKRSLRLIVICGFLCCTVGAAAFAILPWPSLPFAVALYGCGIGVCIPALNLAMAGGRKFAVNANGRPLPIDDEFPSDERAATRTTVRQVTVLNACWTVGAICGPLLLKGIVDVKIFLFLMATACFTCALAALFVYLPFVPRPHADAIAAPKRLLFVSAFAFLFFLYVGTENMISGWISYYSVPVFHSEYRAMTSASVFWTAFLCGRLLSGAYLPESKTFEMVAASVISALFGVVLILFAGSAVPLIIGTAMIGLGLASIYPILITDMARRLGAATPAATVCFSFSGLGATTLPYLSGRISEESGKIRGGLALAIVTLFLLMMVYSTLRPKHRQTAE